MVYLSIDGEEIMSTSPETLVRLENGRLTTFPVAGSRPRGTTPEEDKALEKDLLSDEKELSEHNMLVDLGRNDLGKISNFDSVEVTKYMMIHRYSKIMHICSQVESNIRSDCDGLSAIEVSCRPERFPVHQRSVHVRSSKNWKVNSVGFTAVHSVILILPETWILVSRSAWQSKRWSCVCSGGRRYCR